MLMDHHLLNLVLIWAIIPMVVHQIIALQMVIIMVSTMQLHMELLLQRLHLAQSQDNIIQYGGLIARLVSGIYAQYFLHLSEVLKLDVLNKENQLLELVIVDSGQLGHIFTIELSHLFGAELTNRNTINPAKFLSEHAGGGSGAEYARKSILGAQSILGDNIIPAI